MKEFPEKNDSAARAAKETESSGLLKPATAAAVPLAQACHRPRQVRRLRMNRYLENYQRNRRERDAFGVAGSDREPAYSDRLADRDSVRPMRDADLSTRSETQSTVALSQPFPIHRLWCCRARHGALVGASMP